LGKERHGYAPDSQLARSECSCRGDFDDSCSRGFALPLLGEVVVAPRFARGSCGSFLALRENLIKASFCGDFEIL